MMGANKRRYESKWAQELNDVVRGTCGGFLFGIPLLYTMEVWWIGSHAAPVVLLLVLALLFLVVFVLTRTEGFRNRHRQRRPYEAVMDTVEAMAIGLVCSTLILTLLRELTFSTSLLQALGKVIYESVPFTLGVALANQFLGDREDTGRQQETQSQPQSKQTLNATLSDIGATLLGATIIAFNIAPTDEIPMLAAAVSEPWLLLMIAASLVISYAIVFEAGFSNQQKRRQQQGIFQRPSSETIVSYLVALSAAAVMLWFFQRLNLADPWTMWLEQTILLGLPAAIGGAAGRLAI
jgi:putative integral membrane protein (TIGR02587 family)